MKTESRRAPVLLALLAIAAGVVAAWLVQRELDSAADLTGPAKPVLVARIAIEAGTRIEAEAGVGLVTSVDVPADFAPPDALTDVSEVAALRALTDIPQGGYLTRSAFSGDRAAAGYRLRSGERAISVDAVPAPVGTEPTPGSRVDLIASGIGGSQDTQVLIVGAEVLAVTEAQQIDSQPGEPDDRPTGPQGRLTIRVAASQVPAIVRADVFARELRAVIR